MFYTVYKIINKINNKIYIGAHKTSDLEDGYMGSGKYIKRAYSKYGIENFEKEILEVFDTSEEMYNMESKLVTKDFIQKDTNYNLKEGGEGSFDYINDEKLNIYEGHNKQSRKNVSKAREKSWELLKTDSKYAEKYSSNIKAGLARYFENGGKKSFEGKTHSDESKKKISDSMKLKTKGEGNSQFGTMWIHSLTEKVSKKIKKDEFSDWEAKGWLKGRKMKFL